MNLGEKIKKVGYGLGAGGFFTVSVLLPGCGNNISEEEFLKYQKDISTKTAGINAKATALDATVTALAGTASELERIEGLYTGLKGEFDSYIKGEIGTKGSSRTFS